MSACLTVGSGGGACTLPPTRDTLCVICRSGPQRFYIVPRCSREFSGSAAKLPLLQPCTFAALNHGVVALIRIGGRMVPGCRTPPALSASFSTISVPETLRVWSLFETPHMSKICLEVRLAQFYLCAHASTFACSCSFSTRACVGRETFIPKRLLFGIVPDCILSEYRFWQDESKYNWKSSEPLLEQYTFVQ